VGPAGAEPVSGDAARRRPAIRTGQEACVSGFIRVDRAAQPG